MIVDFHYRNKKRERQRQREKAKGKNYFEDPELEKLNGLGRPRLEVVLP
jgi:hypothetical protein